MNEMSDSLRWPRRLNQVVAERHVREAEHAAVVGEDERKAAEARDADRGARHRSTVRVEHSSRDRGARFEPDGRTDGLAGKDDDLCRSATAGHGIPGFNTSRTRGHTHQAKESVGVCLHERQAASHERSSLRRAARIEDDAFDHPRCFEHDAD